MKTTNLTMKSNFSDDTAIKIHRAIYDIIGAREGLQIEFDLYRRDNGECITKRNKQNDSKFAVSQHVG